MSVLQDLFDLAPAGFGHGPGAFSLLHRVRARRGAVLDPAHDALKYPGQAEHVVGHVEIPILDLPPASASAVLRDILFLVRYAQ